ncbi:MAG: Cof-type HAD-IIB family hydrolase [Candidatus Eremiobacteraeota bacterium]|nr:Cof-type HAD-IIB family hydrolase [Candidatus Eremiobacteraeota bacterium]
MKIRPLVKTALQKAREQNVAGCIVTGRLYRATRRFADELRFLAPVICYQGAGIYDATTGAILREMSLSSHMTMRVTRAAKKDGMHVQLYAGDNYFVEEVNEYSRLYAHVAGVQPVVVESLEETFAGRDSLKIVLIAHANGAAEYLSRVRSLCGAEAYVTRSLPEFIEILHPAVNKGEALGFVCSHLGISLQDVLAIGDSWNDAPLLDAAGFAVAMGSAPPEIQSNADAVVSDVEHDGVAEAINNYVLR